ncbi:hypothetical protein ABBQ38_008711 [Trebouxia sp. C0009 RCD-2024]
MEATSEQCPVLGKAEHASQATSEAWRGPWSGTKRRIMAEEVASLKQATAAAEARAAAESAAKNSMSSQLAEEQIDLPALLLIGSPQRFQLLYHDLHRSKASLLKEHIKGGRKWASHSLARARQ